MTDTQDWRQEALCAQIGGDLWSPTELLAWLTTPREVVRGA